MVYGPELQPHSRIGRMPFETHSAVSATGQENSESEAENE